ncbi:hypothetical protein Tco_0390504 [Tanacetum coccineum]
MDLRQPLPFSSRNPQGRRVRRDDDALYTFKEGDFHRLKDPKTLLKYMLHSFLCKEKLILKSGGTQLKPPITKNQDSSLAKFTQREITRYILRVLRIILVILPNIRVNFISPEDGKSCAWSNINKALCRFNTSVGNPVKKILLKLNLSDHRSILTDSKANVKLVVEIP